MANIFLNTDVIYNIINYPGNEIANMFFSILVYSPYIFLTFLFTVKNKLRPIGWPNAGAWRPKCDTARVFVSDPLHKQARRERWAHLCLPLRSAGSILFMGRVMNPADQNL